jgi:hypothetical protein
VNAPIGDPVARAFAAYFQSAGKSGEVYQQPAGSSGPLAHDGHNYVVLKNGNGVLAVYPCATTACCVA